jgi:SAM-dependent methyltransferase
VGELTLHWKRSSPIDPRAELYPEVAAGGFTHMDGTVEFYQRINALLAPEMTVLDFGAGRGQFIEDEVVCRRGLHRIRGKVASVIGLDVDDVVLNNPGLDRANLIVAGHSLPLEDCSIDLIVSDWTFEHVGNPTWAAGELDRVLRPGGWICARTPNRWGYIGMGARLVPNRLHTAVLRRLQPQKEAKDTFPTAYRMNTMRELSRLFPSARYQNCTYTMNNEPAYFGSSMTAWRLARSAFRLTPTRFSAVLYVFLRKR